MTREEILDAAKKVVTGERESMYGKPEDSFSAIASLWNAYLSRKLMLPIDSLDVSLMMALLKVARASTGQNVKDSLVDLAGYAACAGETVDV